MLLLSVLTKIILHSAALNGKKLLHDMEVLSILTKVLHTGYLEISFTKVVLYRPSSQTGGCGPALTVYKMDKDCCIKE